MQSGLQLTFPFLPGPKCSSKPGPNAPLQRSLGRLCSPSTHQFTFLLFQMSRVPLSGRYLPAFITVVMPITKVFSSHPTKFTQEGLKMPPPFPFMDYGRALMDISQCIFTHRGNTCGVKCSRSWLLNRGTLRLLQLPGEQPQPHCPSNPTQHFHNRRGSARRKHNCTYQS